MNVPGYGSTGYGAPVAQPRNGFGVAALVLGVLAVLSSWTVIGGLVLGILAVIFGLLGRGRVRRGEATNGGLSVAGTVLGAVGVLIAVVLIALAVSVLNTPAGRRYRQCLEQSAGNTTLIERCMTDFSQQLR
jgi:membrane protein implicated in regulation of membrane protease activity